MKCFFVCVNVAPWMLIWSLCKGVCGPPVSICVYAAAHVIRQFICYHLQQQGRQAVLMSIVCFGHHHLGLPYFSLPTLEPNPLAKHNRAGWKRSRLATGPVPLGCGFVPAVCYTVAFETRTEKGFRWADRTCFSLSGDEVHSRGS